MPYKLPYKDWPEDRKELSRKKCRNYHYAHKEQINRRSLKNYHDAYSTESGRRRLIANNRRAVANKRFGIDSRDIVLSRYGYRCVYCLEDNKKNLVIHHLDNNGRRTIAPNNVINNLVSCCKSCHAKIHFHKQELKMKI